MGNYTIIGQIVNCFHDEKFLSISLSRDYNTFYKYLSIFYIQRIREDNCGEDMRGCAEHPATVSKDGKPYVTGETEDN